MMIIIRIFCNLSKTFRLTNKEIFHENIWRIKSGNLTLRKDLHAKRRIFSCKEALNEYILKEIQKCQKRIKKLEKALL